LEDIDKPGGIYGGKAKGEVLQGRHGPEAVAEERVACSGHIEMWAEQSQRLKLFERNIVEKRETGIAG
jgi:hypothetical protein